MAKLLERMACNSTQPVLVARKSMPDDLIASQIQTMRSQVPGLSRTRALRELRRSGIACEQTRFASLWSRTLAQRLISGSQRLRRLYSSTRYEANLRLSLLVFSR